MTRIELGVSWMVMCLALSGCGHSDEEMAAKQAELDRANVLVAETSRQVDYEKREVAKQQAAIDELKADVLRDIEAQETESANNASSSAQTRMEERLKAKKDACECK